MKLHASIDFYYVTILSQCMEIISPYLQEPTLIYHDGSDGVDVIAKSFSKKHPFVIAKVPEQPSNEKLYSMRSTILLAKSPEPMTSILRIWPLWKARSRVVVFIQNSAEVHGWIESLWKKTRAADILVVVLSETPQYFTWFPYKAKECTNVSSIVSVDPSNLFPKKFTPPLHGCPLIAITTVLAPFVVDEMQGLETRLFRDLAENLGMKPTFMKLPLGQNVWTIFDRHMQPHNALKLLFENQVDVLFSEMSMSVVTAPFAEFLMPHFAEQYIFFVPGPIEAPRTTAIFQAFTSEAWTFVIITSLLIYTTMVTIPFVETGRLQSAFIPTIAIILNMSSNFRRSTALLTFVMTAYFYSVHITTAYTSSLIVFLSDVPREKPMQSLHDVVDSGLQVQVHVAFQPLIEVLAVFSPLMDAINQPNRILFQTRVNISNIAARKSSAIGPKISYEFLLRQDMYYDEVDYPLIITLREIIFISFLTFYISKGHPLYEELNSDLIRLIEGGFPGHYSSLVQVPERRLRRNLEPFGMKNVEGPFILLLSSLGACILAWTCEWLYFWLRSLRNKNRALPLSTVEQS